MWQPKEESGILRREPLQMWQFWDVIATKMVLKRPTLVQRVGESN